MLTRVIGIDFGTSTSVMKVKIYDDGKPIGGKKDTKSVTFENGASMLPTLIRESEDGTRWYGYEAVLKKRNTVLHRAFKVQLEDPDPSVRENARALTADFFRYLYSVYNFQRQSGQFGEADAQEVTMVSFPVKWSEETRALMLQFAEDAGFDNVVGMDEAEAAIRSILVMCGESIRTHMQKDVPGTILLADMGAGTTDLVLCRCTLGNGIRNEILSTWPKAGGIYFGGGEMDAILASYVSGLLPEGSRDIIVERIRNRGEFKAWKENYVSPALKNGKTVEEFSELSSLCDIMNVDMPDILLDRQTLEKISAEYLPNLSRLIHGCLEDGGVQPEDVDLVVLTGGHSNWFFVGDILTGKIPSLGSPNLVRIENEADRILRTALPQETVAIGLVMEDELLLEEAAFKAPEPDPYSGSYYIHDDKPTPQPEPVDPILNPIPNPTPNPTQQPEPPATPTGERFILTEGKSAEGLAEYLSSVLSSVKNMETQTVENGNVVLVQARDKMGILKQLVGMDKSITIEIHSYGNTIDVSVGKGKWIDKGIAAAVSWFVFWPLAVTAAVGVAGQVSLKSEINSFIHAYINK